MESVFYKKIDLRTDVTQNVQLNILLKHLITMKTFLFLLSSFFLLFSSFFFTSYCQLPTADSLKARLHQPLHDTDRVNTLNELGWELMYNNPDTAILLGNQALQLSESVILSGVER